MRPAEMYGLRWADVDLRAEEVHVHRQYSPRTRSFEPPKNGRTRTIVLTSPSKAALLDLPRPVDAQELIFRSARGRPPDRPDAALLLAPDPLPVRAAVDGPLRAAPLLRGVAVQRPPAPRPGRRPAARPHRRRRVGPEALRTPLGDAGPRADQARSRRQRHAAAPGRGGRSEAKPLTTARHDRQCRPSGLHLRHLRTMPPT
jgi:hypothetical protein